MNYFVHFIFFQLRIDWILEILEMVLKLIYNLTLHPSSWIQNFLLLCNHFVSFFSVIYTFFHCVPMLFPLHPPFFFTLNYSSLATIIFYPILFSQILHWEFLNPSLFFLCFSLRVRAFGIQLNRCRKIGPNDNAPVFHTQIWEALIGHFWVNWAANFFSICYFFWLNLFSLHIFI